MKAPLRTPVALALGSNLGDRVQALNSGLRGLRALLQEVVVSSVYETEPIHVADQPRFLNACCVGYSSLSPRQLLSSLQGLERSVGRVASDHRFGPRVLDLDILLFGVVVLDHADLRIPHPRLRSRAFVLVPLAELAADWVVPADRGAPTATVGDLAAALDDRGVRQTDIRLDSQ